MNADLLDDEYDAMGAALDKLKADQKAKRDKYNRSESKLQKDIFRAIAERGYLVVRFNSSVQMTDHGTRLAAYRIVNTNATAGLADGVVFVGGGAIFVEIKRPGGKMSDKQKAFQELARSYGMMYIVLTSLDEAYDRFPDRRYTAGK